MLLSVSILLLLVVEGCEGKIGVEGKSSKTQRKCWKNAAEPKVRACTGDTSPTNHQCTQRSEELSTREGHDVNGLDFECVSWWIQFLPCQEVKIVDNSTTNDGVAAEATSFVD